MRTVAVDFDGVIHAYSKGWKDGSIYDVPVPGAMDGIKTVQSAGVAVFVHTTREPVTVANWLCSYGVAAIPDDGDDQGSFWNDTRVVLVTNRKLAAVAYLDDRGIRFESWTQALQDLDQLAGVACRAVHPVR